MKILTKILDVLKNNSTNADMKAFYLVSFQICCLNIAISKIFISKLQVEKILDEEKNMFAQIKSEAKNFFFAHERSFLRQCA